MPNPSRELSLASTICRGKDALSAQVDDAVVLMSIEKGNYYSLDAIGSDIWNRLEQPVSVGDLCDQLTETYDADAATINRDVLALLARLAEEGIIDILA